MISDTLERRTNETAYEYIKRIVYGKLVYKTIDADYEDLSEYIFGEGNCFSSTEVRKRMYGIKRFIELIEEEGIKKIKNDSDEEEILERIRLEKKEFEKEKKRFQDQRREYNKLRDYEARYEHLKNEFIREIRESDNIQLDFNSSPIEYDTSGKDGVLLLSDWHIGLNVENYWNKYNINELYKRIEKLVDKTIEYGKFHKINTLHVFGLGDFTHGLIHISARVASDEDVVSQTKIASEILAQMLAKFSNTFNNVEFYIVTGNHGRVSPSKEESINKENFEEFIMWYLKAKLSKFANIKLHENTYDDDIIVTNILGHICLGVHGDRDKISNVAQNLSLMLKVVPEYIFTADKHHLEENEINGVEVIINRSLSGVDEYAKNIRKTSYAGQTFMIFDREEGRQCTYNIKLN